jgi:hypothetical protein
VNLLAFTDGETGAERGERIRGLSASQPGALLVENWFEEFREKK